MTTAIPGRVRDSAKESIKTLSTLDGSPCLDCVVETICTRSFVDNSACEKFLEFIKELLRKAGTKEEDYKPET